jgi:release factor glutamine methyltransferase
MSALEFSEEAMSLIKENCKETDLELKIISANALIANDYKQFQQESFDCWVSNPPYIPEKEKVLMAKNVLDHEPDMALFVDDDDPLIFYREIAVNALLYLKLGGALYFEIHEDLAEETSGLLEGLGFVNIEVRKDLQGKDRMMKALKVSSRHESE